VSSKSDTIGVRARRAACLDDSYSSAVSKSIPDVLGAIHATEVSLVVSGLAAAGSITAVVLTARG